LRIAIDSNSARFGGERSKLESRIIRIAEEETGLSFPQAHPDWLRDPKSRANLELDGYNADAKIAIEVQGPLHTGQSKDESYARYKKRVARDQFKVARCTERGIALIVVDYRMTDAGARVYLKSRLYDIARSRGQSVAKPRDYIPEQDVVPWSREIK
jgi:hypothetical protein